MSTVGILGGMGPAAGADFERLFVQACAERLQALGLPVSDQVYPPHWLAQLPLPDRSAALETGSDAPLDAMADAMAQLQRLGASAVAMACNTAHAWHARLQLRFPGLDLLHVANEVARRLRTDGVTQVGLMATHGTYASGLYDHALDAAGIVCHLPLEPERAALMRGIYEGVKTGDIALARRLFVDVGHALLRRHGAGTALIMGCTEIPLALQDAPQAAGWRLVNPTWVLAQALAERACTPGPTQAQQPVACSA